MTDDKKLRSDHSRNDVAFDKAPLQDKIGSSLRKLYDDVLSEDVPNDFLDLLKKADSGKSPDSGASSKDKGGSK